MQKELPGENLNMSHNESGEKLHAEIKKIQKACDQCRARKVKCDGLTVCTRCQNKNNECTYNYVFKQRTSKKSRNENLKLHDLVKDAILGNGIEKPKKKRGRPFKEKGKGTPGNNAQMNANGDVLLTSGAQNKSPSITLTPTPTLSVLGEDPLKPLINIRDIIAQKEIEERLENSNIENRLSKMESMISLLLDNFSTFNTSPETNSISKTVSGSKLNLTPIKSNHINGHMRFGSPLSDLNDHSLAGSITRPMGSPSFSVNASSQRDSSNKFAAGSGSEENYNYGENDVQKWMGLFAHTSVFFLSSPGIKILESKVKNPEVLNPLKRIVKMAAPFEANLLSTWKSSVDASNLSPLPNRDDSKKMFDLLHKYSFLAKFVDLNYLKKLLVSYCDFRDNLIDEPNFTASDYLLMNAGLLLGCNLLNYQHYKKNDYEHQYFKNLETALLENSLFFFHRVSIISDGLTTILGSLLLAVHADNVSLSRAAYLILGTTIRQAQELGLHLEETYRALDFNERKMKLNLWWALYGFDKDMCFRWGQAPIINDNDISAPPLPGFEAYWSPNNKSFATETKISKRELFACEIQALFETKIDSAKSLESIEGFLLIDYSFIISNIYRTFLRAGALFGKSKSEVEKLVNKSLSDLDNWKNNLPLEIRPNSEYDLKFFQHLEKLTHEATTDVFSSYKLFLLSSFHVRYHHAKGMIYRAFTKHCLLEDYDTNREFLTGPHVSIRSILKAASIIDANVINFGASSMFYPFNAFLALCGLYIYLDEKNPDMKDDLQLLVDTLRLHFMPYAKNGFDHCKSKIIIYVLTSMLYATYKSVVDKFGDLELEHLEIFDQIKLLSDEKLNDSELFQGLFLPMSEFSGGTEQRKKYIPTKLPLFATPDSTITKLSNNLFNLDRKEVDRTSVAFLLTPNHNRPNEVSPSNSGESITINSTASSNYGNTLRINNELNGPKHVVNNSDQNHDIGPFVQTPITGDPELYVKTSDTFFHNLFNIPNYHMDFGNDQHLPTQQTPQNDVMPDFLP